MIHQHLVIFVNVATFARHWEGTRPLLLEQVIAVAASIANHGVEDRYLVGLMANGSIPHSDQPIKVLPSRRPDQLARVLEAGLHLPSAQLMALTRRPELEWVGASCHDAEELAKAVALGLDWVVLGPVQTTSSHPGATPMGWAAFARLIQDCPLPVYALGGLTARDIDLARNAGAHGLALRSAAWQA